MKTKVAAIYGKRDVRLREFELPEITDNEKYIMYEFAPHWDRYDHSSFMLRSSFPRLQFKNQATVQDSGFGDKKEAKEDKSIPHHDCGKKVFTRGDVLVVNDNLAHYRGELEVVLTEIPNDGETARLQAYGYEFSIRKVKDKMIREVLVKKADAKHQRPEDDPLARNGKE